MFNEVKGEGLAMLQSRIILKFAVCIFILLTASPLCFAQAQILSIEEITQIDLGTEISCIAINEKLNRIYVGVDDTVVVIDGATKQVMTTVKIDENPDLREEVQWIVVDSLNNQIWVSVKYENKIWVIDGETYALRDTGLAEQLQDNFALDPLRKRVYTTESALFKGDFDRINIYDSTDFTELGHMNIPGSDTPIYVTSVISILLDSELNHIYVDWLAKLFVFDCASETIISNPNGTEFLSIQDITQVYENKIYTTGGIVDANTLQYILYFNINEVRAFDPRNSIVYGLRSRPTDWNNYSDWSTGTKYSFQAIDTLTNKTVASSNKVFTYDECGKSAKVNLQTGEIYLGGKSGLLYVLTMTSSPLLSPNEQGTSPPIQKQPVGTYIIVAVAIITITAIVALGFVLRRKSRL